MKIYRKARGVFAALLICGSAAAAHGAERASIQLAAQSEKGNDYRVTNLVSDEPGEAPLIDPKLVNAWGIAASATSPWWVANNGTDSSTLYTGAGAKVGLEVDVPGAPTGIVFNGGSSFQLAAGAPARFIFVSESGSFLAWNGVGHHRHRIPGRSGLRLQGPGDSWRRPLHDRFHGVRGGSLRGELLRRQLRGFPTQGGFEDDSIPAGFCPFGIQAIGNSIFVTYAKKGGVDDVAGVGNGFVREFDTDGNLLAKVASHGQLNSPWGVAQAPAEGFGKFSGCLLVGNFGDGKINAYCQNPAGQWHHAGRLREGAHALSIDGLWGIGFGNGANSGDDARPLLRRRAGRRDARVLRQGRVRTVGSPRRVLRPWHPLCPSPPRGAEGRRPIQEGRISLPKTSEK